LNGNFPNPFNPSTIIWLDDNRQFSQTAKVKIYDLKGSLVRSFLFPVNGAGRYNISWDGKSDNGRGLPAGIYFYKIQINNAELIGKMVMVK